MAERKELIDGELEEVTGGYIGYDYDWKTGIGNCGLGEDRSYSITDITTFESILEATKGQGDIARMKQFLSAGCIVKK